MWKYDPILRNVHSVCTCTLKWQDRIQSTEFLRIIGISGTEAFLLQAQFQRSGHVMRMPAITCIRHRIFCQQLAKGKRLPGGRHMHYKDGLKQNLKTCGISPNALSASLAWASRWSCFQDAIDDFEATCVGAIQARLQARKTTTIQTITQLTCDRCGHAGES